MYGVWAGLVLVGFCGTKPPRVYQRYVAANPNAVYSTQGSMPRAYFITASYKFKILKRGVTHLFFN
jgi:hypothetical protein